GADGAEVRPAAAGQEAIPLLTAREDEEGAPEPLVEAETAQHRRGQRLVVGMSRDPEDRGDSGECRGHARGGLVLRSGAGGGQEKGGSENRAAEVLHGGMIQEADERYYTPPCDSFTPTSD